ncbi:hypothetical protein BSPWISOXPB_398 [uncultured Gammaproteobacteria bacterium]|nr:hypothetical protein BSPWISOXPB_398 [uncultured Gammaproteobacteria bacterium]
MVGKMGGFGLFGVVFKGRLFNEAMLIERTQHLCWHYERSNTD